MDFITFIFASILFNEIKVHSMLYNLFFGQFKRGGVPPPQKILFFYEFSVGEGHPPSLKLTEKKVIYCVQYIYIYMVLMFIILQQSMKIIKIILYGKRRSIVFLSINRHIFFCLGKIKKTLKGELFNDRR